MKPKEIDTINTDFCVCCGEPVPEGRMVCQSCEQGDFVISQRKSAMPKKKCKSLFGRLKERDHDRN